jgi:TolB-like protein
LADVFLSYKREDAARVRKLVAALREAGLDVWWDEDIPPSAPWEATIEKALAEARTVIVCWSPASIASENVRSEARVAREDGRLIQVFVKPSSPPLFFGERQGVDLTKWGGKAEDPRIAQIAERVREVAGCKPITHAPPATGRRLEWALTRPRIFAIIAGAFLLLGVGGAIAWRAAMARPAPEIAVLPFEDLSPTHDKAYFAEGVAEEILSSLSTDQAIKVLGRTSARQIDRNADPKALRKSLGISHLLEGSARTAGDALRVDVRLIDTGDGTTVWQEQYHGRLSDIFSVQDRIASAVVQHLRSIFSPAPALAARPETRVNVYETYLAARSIMRKRSEPTLRKALGLAKQVIATDPDYAPGQAIYAELVYLLSDDPDTYGTIPVATAKRVAATHARAAIRLAPSQADGYAALGMVTDDATAISALKRAIALDPSRADVRIWLAIHLTKAGRYDGALQLDRDAVAIEPLWPLPLYDLVVRLAVNGQIAEARQVAEQYHSRSQDQGQYGRLLFAIDSRGPDISSAIAKGEKAEALDPTLPPDVSVTLLELYSLVGLSERVPGNPPPTFVRLAKPFYARDINALDARIRGSGSDLWKFPDSGIAFFHLAAVHDWTMLNHLYDERPMTTQKLCFLHIEAAQAMLPALRAARRQFEAEGLLSCLGNRSAIEAQQKIRSSWYAYFGDFEYDQATLAALAGNREGAVHWLEQAVARGWLGRPYSPSISDRPQFDALRADPRVAALQARIDRTIAQERAKVLSGRPSAA